VKVVLLRSNPVDPDPRVEKEVNTLIKAGYKVTVIAWDRDSKYKIKESNLELENGKVKIYRFGIPASFGGGIRKNLGPLISFQFRLYNWLYQNRDNYDIIHACDFDTAFTSFKVAKKLKKKFIYDIFDYYVDSFSVPSYLKQYIEKKDHDVINAADAVIICSEKRKEQIKGSTPKQLSVIHNSPASSIKTLEKFTLEKSKIKLVYVGVLGNGRFLREITEILKGSNEFEFHVGGFGELHNYFQDMSNKYSNIKFYGKLPYKQTLGLESSCDVMLAIYDPKVPNHYFASPNKFYEALMLGKPIIMVKNTGMSEVVLEKEIGELIDFNKHSFSKALFRIINRKKEWSIIEHKMKKIYQEYYSWEIMEKRLLYLYEDILN
jgi:glycosyltransferase involved in cell wall biosynthesis